MFNNILGNDRIKELLINSIKMNKTSHSYLFVGTEGIGKTLIAKEFAKMILCSDENKYCNKCKSCIEFDTNNNPDFKIIEPDGNSLKIEQIREFQSKVAEKPIISNKKVYIIKDSDKMTQEAQNCLLKTLEEPPGYVVIILIGSNENAFLSTIKSRCMILHFDKISNEEIEKYLEENHQIKINSKIMIDAFQGSIGKALQLKEKQEEYERIEEIIYNLENKDKIDILNMSEIIYKSKDDKQEILDYMNVVFLNLAKKSSKYANCIHIVEETKKRLQSNANYDMCIDNMLFSLWEQVN
ncbi:MAG: DNA polymerase III subunit delta' [Clostridia bacterium]|nr:DNA polymerase III subunit delta' [Clostridia bacterium]